MESIGMKVVDVKISVSVKKDVYVIGVVELNYAGRKKIFKYRDTMFGLNSVSNRTYLLECLYMSLFELKEEVELKVYFKGKVEYSTEKKYSNKIMSTLVEMIEDMVNEKGHMLAIQEIDEKKDRGIFNELDTIIRRIKESNGYVNKRIYLDVPFKEKEEAKSLGARWDSALKKWYCSEWDKERFKRWKA